MPRYCFQLQVKPDRIAEYRRTARRRLARHARGPARHGLAQLLALPATRRPAHRLRRVAGPHGRPGGHGRHRGQRPLAGRDGRVLRRPRRPARPGVRPPRGGLPPRGPARPHHRRPPPQRPRTGTCDDDLRRDHRPAREASPSRSRRGPTATPAPASRSSARPAPRARSRRRSPTPPTVHRFTGLAPTVALHIPWDLVDDFAELRKYAADQGVGLGTINSNTFQDDDYKLGSLTHADPAVRRKAVQHNLDCIEVMNATGSRDLKIWLADGTNYPGQGDIRARQDWLAEGLAEIYAQLVRGPAAGAGVQVLRAGVLPHGRAGLGHVVRARSRPRRPGHGLPRHRPPRARHQHRVHRRPAAAAREAGLLRLQQPLLRRRRPDRRRGRPVPALPDPGRGRPRRRLRARVRRAL